MTKPSINAIWNCIDWDRVESLIVGNYINKNLSKKSFNKIVSFYHFHEYIYSSLIQNISIEFIWIELYQKKKLIISFLKNKRKQKFIIFKLYYIQKHTLKITAWNFSDIFYYYLTKQKISPIVFVTLKLDFLKNPYRHSCLLGLRIKIISNK